MEEALLRILTPRRSIDILRDVHAAKERGKPYVIVFVGVNGVGKSTNLAKVCNPDTTTKRKEEEIFPWKITHSVFI
jgi:signal recognition particle GTPase